MSLQKTINSSSRFKKPAPRISKGKMFLAEMSTKKEEAGRVNITAGLYLVSKKKDGTDIMKKVKFTLALWLKADCLCFDTKVPQVHFCMKFDEKMSTFDALGSVLLDAQEYHCKG